MRQFYYLFFALSVFTIGSLQGQPTISLNHLQGPGDATVYADEDGTLRRALNTDGNMYYNISPLDFDGRPLPFPITSAVNRELYAPLHFPDGVKLKNLTFWYKDRTPADLFIEIFQRDLTNSSLILTRRVMGTPDEPTPVSIDIPPTLAALVNNKDYTYYLRIATVADGVLVDWPAGITFYKARIEYGF